MSTNDPAKKPVALITPVFIVSFPHLEKAQPTKTPGGTDKFGTMAIFKPALFTDDDKARWRLMTAAADAACRKKFAGKGIAEMPPNFKKPWHRGDEKAKYDMTADQIFINITSNFKPQMIDADATTPILDGRKFYAGCYARASVNAYGYDNLGIGVAFGINNIMFVRDGARIDNRVEAAVEFAGLAENAGGDDDMGLGLGIGIDPDNIPF